jgi:SpoVK/Ycf46/Vps4 family AAA+-type ATPase
VYFFKQLLGLSMSRADLLVSLVKAGSEGNQPLFKTTVEALAAEERAKHHHQLAKKLEENLIQKKPSEISTVTKSYDGGHGGLLYEIVPQRNLDSIILDKAVKDAIREVIEEQHRRDLLRSHGLEPRHKLLFSGPPGNGKTTLAEAIANELMTPLFVVRYEAVIGSFLGETSGRLKKLFDFVRNHECVLFFDEFDTLGKERGDKNETGEIKRVVSSLLLQIDSLPSNVIVITATNHAELLDRAAWRRFQLRLNLEKPNLTQKKQWFARLQGNFKEKLGYTPEYLAKNVYIDSFSDLQEFSEDLLRRYVLSPPKTNLKSIVQKRIQQWKLRKSIKK